MILVHPRSHSFCRWAAFFAAAIVGLCLRSPAVASEMPAAAPAVEAATPIVPCCHAVREHDEIWLISTRGLGCPSGSADPALQISKYDGNGGWTDSSLTAFLATDNPAVPTDVFVHGNFDTAQSAEIGLSVYGQIAAQAPVERPLRFVIWTWPADRGKHPLQLTRSHAHRSDADAYYLGWLVNRIDHRVKIGLVGYSLGARVVTGAAHLLGGGQLLGLTLPLDAKPPRQTVRVTLLAAAEDCDWLSPGRPNGETLSFVDKMLLLNNGCDRVLKYYPRLDRCSGADALGYVGFCGPFDPQKVEQRDVCCAIGKEHDWSNYFSNAGLVAEMLPYLFLDAKSL